MGRYRIEREDPAGRHTDPESVLREQAEKAARAEPPVEIPEDLEGLTPEAVLRLLHELRVHEIELEIQNEELRRARSELEDSKARYFDLYEMAPVGYLTVSSLGLVVEANLTAAAIFGVEKNGLVGRPLTRFIAPEDQDVYYEHRRRVLGGRETQTCELRLKTAGTLEEWVRLEMVAAPEPDETIATRTVVTSIADRRQTEAALRASESLYRALVESMGDGVAVKDLDGRFVAVNGALAKRLGRTPEEVVGRLTEDVYPPEHSVPIRDREREVIAGGRMVESAYVTQTADGPRSWETQNNPLIDAAGAVVGVVTVSRDVTDRERMQERLRRAEQLEVAGRIAGQVAHDLNNLLSPLLAYPDLIRSELPSGHPAVGYCETMMSSAQRAAQIADDLLTFARRGHVAKRPVDLNVLVLEAESALELRLPGLLVEHDLAADLLPVLGSDAQVGRVISNLLANAREAMGDDGTLRMTTANVYVDGSGPVPRGEFVVLTVADTGCGIAPDNRDRIFDPFFTTKSGERKRGAGLGMSIVRSVVEDHGGHVTFESEVARGTTFSVYLPVHRAPPATVDKRIVVRGSETVLIVDDDALQRDLLDGILSTLGYRVTGAPSGEAALALIRQNDYDLVILDMVMPGGWDGTETLRRIREIRPRQRTLIASGYAQTDRVAEALALGAGAFLRKPLTVGALARAVRAELGQR